MKMNLKKIRRLIIVFFVTATLYGCLSSNEKCISSFDEAVGTYVAKYLLPPADPDDECHVDLHRDSSYTAFLVRGKDTLQTHSGTWSVSPGNYQYKNVALTIDLNNFCVLGNEDCDGGIGSSYVGPMGCNGFKFITREKQHEVFFKKVQSLSND